MTASEAEFAGPWKLEPLPGHPGAVAVLRACESLAEGDEPEAIFLEEETARICVAILPGVEREPLYHLREDGDEEGLMAGGFPILTIHGEEGPRVRGWLRHYHPPIVRDLQTVELLNRSPAAHAAVLAAGGGGALERIGRERPGGRRRSRFPGLSEILCVGYIWHAKEPLCPSRRARRRLDLAFPRSCWTVS